ncbi:MULTISPECIES: Nramp family divalent metal transporter [Streptomyces]|uniref:Divalent metal cation transporter MntH n=1 Tax=Streptomyces chartreusis NRRL 3882 TaxID=1079985 RepID=A0A2N9B381_STRCX|nr:MULTISPECIES: Nramp family divalent metal transporter [Streptomyces]MYS89676.1 divalent metal cation transporter [Streptomyces sp. SID5464]SOR77801.1 Divalent metal cation transporter MntH [Streptomyces chartreusis NRRL 3882]
MREGTSARPPVVVRPGRLGAALIGPGFVAAVAYVDPGNFATNFSAGAGYGTGLLWVLLTANLVGILVQYLSAKAGLASGRNLAQLCREHCPRYVVMPLWVQAELVAIATDLAEIVGGAIALNLLFGLPLLAGGIITAVLSFAILALETRHRRAFEGTIALLLALIVASFLWTGVQSGAYAPGLTFTAPDGESAMLAAGIIGATVMPHAVYVHSDLTSRHRRAAPVVDEALSRPGGRAAARPMLRRVRTDVWAALGVAGLVNASMLLVAARVFERDGTGPEGLEGVHAGLGEALGGHVALLFAFALLVSGLASSSVGTYAGQVAMAGFLRRSVPATVRRLCTVAPALLVLGFQIDATTALLWSQAALSLGLPFTLVPLVWLTSRTTVMGSCVNRRLTTAAAVVVTGGVIAANCVLLRQELGG